MTDSLFHKDEIALEYNDFYKKDIIRVNKTTIHIKNHFYDKIMADFYKHLCVRDLTT